MAPVPQIDEFEAYADPVTGLSVSEVREWVTQAKTFIGGGQLSDGVMRFANDATGENADEITADKMANVVLPQLENKLNELFSSWLAASGRTTRSMDMPGSDFFNW